MRLVRTAIFRSFCKCLLVSCIFYPPSPVRAQNTADHQLSLNDDLKQIRKLSAETPNDQTSSTPYVEAFGKASATDLAKVLPQLIDAFGDPEPNVRVGAILAFYTAASVRTSSGEADNSVLEVLSPALVRLMPHLSDPDPRVHGTATLAYLQFLGLPEARAIILPALLERLKAPVVEQAEERETARPLIVPGKKFPQRPLEGAEIGVEAVGTVAGLGHNDFATSEAVITYLNRPDQTKVTLAACFQNIALSHANERVNNEVIRLIFEHRAMSIFLLQYLAQMQLTPNDYAIERRRLIALANDPSAHPALRRAAKAVAKCWTLDFLLCQPSEEDMKTQQDKAR